MCAHQANPRCNVALEPAIDELCVALKHDPLQFRLINHATHDPHDNGCLPG
jgi:CO/xanthine dehydrogenase Mo-binding subunit